MRKTSPVNHVLTSQRGGGAHSSSSMRSRAQNRVPSQNTIQTQTFDSLLHARAVEGAREAVAVVCNVCGDAVGEWCAQDGRMRKWQFGSPVPPMVSWTLLLSAAAGLSWESFGDVDAIYDPWENEGGAVSRG